MSSNKKPRLNENLNDGETSESCIPSPVLSSSCFPCRVVNVTDLPEDVLSQVFGYFSYEKIAVQIRPVCRRFCIVATNVLNSGLAALNTRIERAMSGIELRMNLVETENELLVMSRCFNALEIVKYQYVLLRAVTWRYVSNQFSGEPLACFYGGLLIDNFLELLSLSLNSPRNLSRDFHFREPGSSIIGKLCEKATKFMDHFESVTELKINVHYSISGAKIVDLLDCLVETDNRKELYMYVKKTSSEGCCKIKAVYRMERSWFTCLQMQDTGERDWMEEQRLMYLRLRRLITNHNKHLLEQIHQDRENLLQTIPGSPLTSTYSGYGEYGGVFFYYGSMNLTAFHSNVGSNNNDRENSNNSLDEEDTVLLLKYDPPSMDLEFCIEIECPLDLAPIKYLEQYEVPDVGYRYDSIVKSLLEEETHPPFELTTNTFCPLSLDNRLPSMFTWAISSKDLGKLNLSSFKHDTCVCVPTEKSENSDF